MEPVITKIPVPVPVQTLKHSRRLRRLQPASAQEPVPASAQEPAPAPSLTPTHRALHLRFTFFKLKDALQHKNGSFRRTVLLCQFADDNFSSLQSSTNIIRTKLLDNS